jgi:hypothetical protein
VFVYGKHEIYFEGLAVENLDVDVLVGIPCMKGNDISIRPAKHEIRIGDNQSTLTTVTIIQLVTLFAVLKFCAHQKHQQQCGQDSSLKLMFHRTFPSQIVPLQ